MLPVILRLFRWTPLFQLLLSGAAFFALMVLITIRLLYAYGLTASLSSSAPHLTAEFIEGESEDEARLAALRQAFEHAESISAFSPFLKGTRTLKIESPAYMIGQYKFEAPVEITGIDLKRFPFAIPLEQAESLKNKAYTTYTMKELAGQLLFSKQAVVVNEAMANLFAPRPGMAGEFIVWDSSTEQPLGEVRIVAVLSDLLDTPRMIVGLPLARQLLGKTGVQGIHARVSDLQALETVRETLNRKVGGFARIGLRGTLTLEASSPEVLQRFYRVWQVDPPAVPFSLAWTSNGAITLELKQGTRSWKRQVKVLLLEQEYLRQKLSAQQAGCATNQTQAYGNPLLWLTLVGFDPVRSATLQTKPFGEQKLHLRFSSCPLETGMMTDYPILFLSGSALEQNFVGMARQLELSAPTAAETEQWQGIMDAVLQTLPLSATEWFEVSNVFESEEMRLAAALSAQARFIAAVVFLITLALSALILFFGFSLLLEFKHKVTAILRMIGISRAAVAVGFMMKGAQIGVFVAGAGCLIAVAGRWSVRQGAWIPFEHFFMPWPFFLFVGILTLVPLGIAFYNAVLIYGLLWQADRKAGVIRSP